MTPLLPIFTETDFNSFFRIRDQFFSPEGANIEAALREGGGDVDFFEISGLPAGAFFDTSVRIDESTVPPFAPNLGRFDEDGNLIGFDLGDPGNSRGLLNGLIPNDGILYFAVTGETDFNFGGEDRFGRPHGQVVDYNFQVRPFVLPTVEETDFNSRFDIRDQFSAPEGVIVEASLREGGGDVDYFEFFNLPAGEFARARVVHESSEDPVNAFLQDFPVLFLFDSQGNVVADDLFFGTSIGQGLGSRVPDDGSLVFAVTGIGDELPDGSHDEAGDYSLVLTVSSAGRSVQDDTLPTFTESDINSFFRIRDKFSSPDGAIIEASLEERPRFGEGGVDIPSDRDFFEISGLPAAALFKAEIVETPEFPRFDDLNTILGQFDNHGDVIQTDNNSGQGTNSRLAGLIPDDGILNLAVSGWPDFDFDGIGADNPEASERPHGQVGDYQLLVERIVLPTVEETDFNSRFNIRDQFSTPEGVIVEASLREGGGDVDYFELFNQPAGAFFEADIIVDAGGPRTVFGQFDSHGNLIEPSFSLDLLQTRLSGLVPNDGVLNFAVSGAFDYDFDGDDNIFGGPHEQIGNYHLVVQTTVLPVVEETDFNSRFNIRDEFSAPDGVFVEANLRDDGKDVDYFQFSDLPAGGPFAAEIVPRGDGLQLTPDSPARRFESTRLGQFDNQGNLIDEDGAPTGGSGGGPEQYSRLTGIVPNDGIVHLALTGVNDLDYDGREDFNCTSDCGGHGLIGDYALVLEIAGTADNELLLDTGGADAIM